VVKINFSLESERLIKKAFRISLCSLLVDYGLYIKFLTTTFFMFARKINVVFLPGHQIYASNFFLNVKI